jgi:hypothetical protein
MKLYHASPIENKESIINNGLCKMVTDKITLSDEQITDEGIFGFSDIDSANDFGVDCCGGEYVIFSFDADEVIIDPEYDGNSFFTVSSIKNLNIVNN